MFSGHQRNDNPKQGKTLSGNLLYGRLSGVLKQEMPNKRGALCHRCYREAFWVGVLQ
jgi:hypothetical protein